MMRIAPGLAGDVNYLAIGRVVQNVHSRPSPSARSTLTAPRIGTHQSSMQLGTGVGLESSVPHVPCNEPEHRGEFPAPFRAFAWKNGYRDRPSTPGPVQTGPRWRRRCGSGQLARTCRHRQQPEAQGGTEPRSAPPGVRPTRPELLTYWGNRTSKLSWIAPGPERSLEQL